jgi:transposase
MHITSVGIDLGKNTFHLVALGEHSKVLVRKKFSRAQLLAYTANLPSSLIGLEACAGAHFMGARLREQGHEVRSSLPSSSNRIVSPTRMTSSMAKRSPKP